MEQLAFSQLKIHNRAARSVHVIMLPEQVNALMLQADATFILEAQLQQFQTIK